jgi:ATP-dependent helicase HrpB
VTLTPLPIDPVLPEVAAALRGAGAVVLRAPTGAGKTTRVPPAVAALLDATAGEHRQVVMLEPRRIAARAAARRMAAEHGWTLGGEVGYQVRFDRRAGAGTRILVVTEGILLQRLQADPFLDGVGAVLFDELHERSLEADLALAMARRVQREVRPDLKLAAMSATLDPAPLVAFLGGCPAIESEGFLHPVVVEWLDPADRRLRAVDATPGAARPSDIAQLAAYGVRRMLGEVAGDVLCFLPGVGEIRRVAEALAPLAGGGLLLAPLYGDLPPAEQDAVLSPADRRRVVLATNVAETSVTIEGIEAVVDSGWARVLRFDPASGLDRLELARISRASAAQRTGRAGRLGPGRCLRLWSEHEHRGLPERETPEIVRVDLAGAALQLLAWGERDLAAFPWFEAPEPAALAAAEQLLRRLGAVGSQGVTELGRAMAALPAHPRLARLLAEGRRLGHPHEAALAAALLAERFPLRRGRGEGPARHSRSDLLDAAEAVERFATGGAWTAGLNPAAARFVLRARDQLEALVRGLPGAPNGGPPPRGAAGSRRRRAAAETAAEGAESDADRRGAPSAPPDPEEAVLRAVLAAFPDRVCRRRQPGSPRAVMVGGRGVELADASAVRDAEQFVAVELSDRRGGAPGAGGAGGEALVWIASAVEPAWLPEERLETTTEVGFDPARRRAVAHRRTRYEDLVLAEDEVPVTVELAPAAERALAAAAAADLAAALPLDEEPAASFLARLRSLAEWRPELGLPRFDDAELAALLPALVRGRRSFDELRRAPLADVLRGMLDHHQLAALEREAPERLEVPSGSRVRLAYEPGRPPVLAVRIQEMFGARETPAVAGGRVPVLLHLLAPNLRPQQVTDDLASFWRNTYPQVRKELAGRYPKHAWPADPLAASPQRRPGRRR